MLEVWGRWRAFNVQKVLWTLSELGVSYEHIDAGGCFGGLDTPEFLARNPHGRIPVVVDGESVHWESHAIIRYLAATYGAGSLWPEDPAVRSLTDRWMDWELGTALTMGDLPAATCLYRYLEMGAPVPELPYLRGGYEPVAERAGYSLARAGQADQAREILGELIRRSRQRYIDPIHMARVLAGLEDRDEFFKWLEPAYDMGSLWVSFIHVSPVYDGVRDDPRFRDLFRRLGLPQAKSGSQRARLTQRRFASAGSPGSSRRGRKR